MTEKYVRKLKEGTMKFNDVPRLWSTKVRNQLEVDGYIINEDGTVEKEKNEDE